MGCQTLAYTLDLMVEAACEMEKKLHFGVGRTLHFNPTWVPLSLQQNLLSICCILCLVSSGDTAVWEIEVVPALRWATSGFGCLLSLRTGDSSCCY